MRLDVHKETIRVALAEGGVRGEVGRIAHAAAALKHLVSKLAGDGVEPFVPTPAILSSPLMSLAASSG
jgi:hypothetical protein